jgi:hypothetical protein
MARTAPCLLLAMCLLAATLSAELVYKLDDGSGAFNIGPSQFDAQMLWGNYFDAAPGCEVIDRVAVSFSGSVPLGQTVTLAVFDDPDDDLDPSDAVPLSQVSGLTVSAAPNTLIEYDVPDVRVSGGFFVAAMMNLQMRQVAARMDNSTNAGRSWLFFDSQINLGNLGGSPLFYNMASSPFPGTWMVRAVGVPEPAGVLLVGVAAAFLFGGRRDSGRLSCSAAKKASTQPGECGPPARTMRSGVRARRPHCPRH